MSSGYKKTTNKYHNDNEFILKRARARARCIFYLRDLDSIRGRSGNAAYFNDLIPVSMHDAAAAVATATTAAA